MKLVVADSGPLIALASTELLDVLRQVAGSVVVPHTVFGECTRVPHHPGAQALLAAQGAGLLTLHPDGDASVLGPIAALDAGETAALSLALQLQAPVLMDERLGRRVAALHGIPVIGSAGVLLAAKQRGLIATIAPVLAQWQGQGYFLSERLVAAVLKQAGEAA